MKSRIACRFQSLSQDRATYPHVFGDRRDVAVRHNAVARIAELAYLLRSLFSRSVLQQRMDGGGEELGAGGFGLGEFGFQGVAQGQQLGDLSNESPLILKRDQRDT